MSSSSESNPFLNFTNGTGYQQVQSRFPIVRRWSCHTAEALLLPHIVRSEQAYEFEAFFTDRTSLAAKRKDPGPGKWKTESVDSHGFDALNILLVLVVFIYCHVRDFAVTKCNIVVTCPIPTTINKEKTNQIRFPKSSLCNYLGPRPPSFTPPSTWVAAVETPYKNPLGNFRSRVVACKYAGLNRGGSGPTEKLARGSRTLVMLAFTTGMPPCSTDCHTRVDNETRVCNKEYGTYNDLNPFEYNLLWLE